MRGRDLFILGVPSSAGAFAAGQERAPAALREAGLVERLAAAGDVLDLGDLPEFRWRPDRAQPLAQHAAQVAETAAAVRDAVAGRLALRQWPARAGWRLHRRVGHRCRQPPGGRAHGARVPGHARRPERAVKRRRRRTRLDGNGAHARRRGLPARAARPCLAVRADAGPVPGGGAGPRAQPGHRLGAVRDRRAVDRGRRLPRRCGPIRLRQRSAHSHCSPMPLA